MRFFLPITFVAASLGLSLSHGADSQGNFMTGGGMGSLGCTDFLNDMATARQQGGLARLPGVNTIAPFQRYVVGFTTGYNMGNDGVYHIFEAFGQNYSLKVLLAIEPWCANNPTKKFDAALIHLVGKLRDEQRK